MSGSEQAEPNATAGVAPAPMVRRGYACAAWGIGGLAVLLLALLCYVAGHINPRESCDSAPVAVVAIIAHYQMLVVIVLLLVCMLLRKLEPWVYVLSGWLLWCPEALLSLWICCHESYGHLPHAMQAVMLLLAVPPFFCPAWRVKAGINLVLLLSGIVFGSSLAGAIWGLHNMGIFSL